ncbi:hypothetical protein [Rhodococcus sp. 21391]|nr:hypothetical protein [Rhodococcus sp. 21391]QQZ16783.1 hypothetical protein GO592_11940 [Rhodococcus sp. 21391]
MSEIQVALDTATRDEPMGRDGCRVKELPKRRRPVAAWWGCPGSRAYRQL